MKYKNVFSLLKMIFVILTLSSCGNNRDHGDFQLKGKITNSNAEFIALVDINSSLPRTIDSVKINKRGEFVFIKKVSEKGFYNLQLSSSNYATIIADSAEKITFEGNAKNLDEGHKISGSIDSELLLQFNDYTKKKFKEMESTRLHQDSIRRVFEVYMNTIHDSIILDSFSKSLEPIFDSCSDKYKNLAEDAGKYIKRFIDENTSSFACLAAVQMLSIKRDMPYFIKVSETLTAKYPHVETLKQFKAYVDGEKRLAEGMPAPEITMNDKEGTPHSLSSLQGKVVIVDFWASWCKPCRVENPFLVLLYEKYRDKGLDIFSVSLDFNKEAWLGAIIKDKLIWKNHVCDMKQWQSPVVTLYGFEGIPFTCLLDKKGNIAGKNLRGSQLEKKVRELLNAP